MGLTVQEFLRTLPAAIGHNEYRVDDREIRIRQQSGEVLIRLQPTFKRRFGALAIPATPVEFRFSGLDSGERSAFLERFDLYFQRGGG